MGISAKWKAGEERAKNKQFEFVSNFLIIIEEPAQIPSNLSQ